jgi:dTDP-4-dehydrorhamnose reductase
MRALIVGGEGQVGRALADVAPADAEIIRYGSATLDITDGRAVEDAVASIRPDLLFNAAAYTAVDRAEQDADRAMAVNATAVGDLARAARMAGARFVHISTDFVFDGTATRPYAPDALAHPLGVYGRTKLAGEKLAGDDALIVRTAWVYAVTGRNFVHTMLRLMAHGQPVRVVADQVGAPTFAPSLARALWTLAMRGAKGVHHYTDAGVTSWHGFAVAIQEEALAAGLLSGAVPVVPIATADYPTPARRPAYSVLDTSATYAALGAPPPHWRDNLRSMIGALAREGDRKAIGGKSLS